jgi:hypothetical protein
MVFAGLVALPLSVSGQDAKESTTVEPSAEESAPPSEPAPRTQVPDIDTLSQRAIEHYEMQTWRDEGQGSEIGQMELRVKRAKIGLDVSTGVVGAGVAMALVAGSVALAQWGNDKPFDRAEAALAAALAISSAGIIGMVTAGGILVHRKRKARKFEHYETPRRVRWDIARSALVF